MSNTTTLMLLEAYKGDTNSISNISDHNLLIRTCCECGNNNNFALYVDSSQKKICYLCKDCLKNSYKYDSEKQLYKRITEIKNTDLDATAIKVSSISNNQGLPISTNDSPSSTPENPIDRINPQEAISQNEDKGSLALIEFIILFFSIFLAIIFQDIIDF